MGLTGAGTVVVAVVVVVVGLAVATVVCWNRIRPRWRWPARLGLLLAGDLAAVLVVALLLNDAYAFYPSWSELLGDGAHNGETTVAAGSLDPSLHQQLAAAAQSGHGTLVPLRIEGPAAHLVTGVSSLVYLPAVYGDPAWANTRFPVVELLDGYPGSPGTWTGVLHVQDILDAEIAEHRMPPTIAVMAVSNVDLPRDTECANVVHGPQVDTYLTDDVRTAVTTAFRASESGYAWTLAGFSTGGYCAGVIAARHPQMFAAAASIDGYAAAAHDHTTGDLFGDDTALRERADLHWWMRHPPSPRVPLLLMASRQDAGPWHSDTTLAVEAVRARWPVSQLVLPTGGHDASTFDAEIPVALSWLAHAASGPLAPVPSVDGLLPSPVLRAPQDAVSGDFTR
ncbi:alpha/beta hydrolase [Jatrophihabitans sp. YIM 134969]